ncbi:hypothetical protein FS837_000660 [Tulasnella sp. UAMH 9824]|nr:hypothetical protein FS837_000660 [Tulasnella sp. UAMH 9824]
MSKLPPSLMRLYALPIARPSSSALRTGSTNGAIAPQPVYYYARMPKKSKLKADGTRSKPSLLQRGTKFATKTWTEWGQAEGGWKLKVHNWGESIYERIDFEELALKAVDPALGPKLKQESESSHTVSAEVKKAVESGQTVVVPLYHPPSALPDPLAHLKNLLSERTPNHRKWMTIWIAVSPLTAPFAIIPIIPNIPFFFCIWRAWSHWRAYRGAKFLNELIEHRCLVPTPHPALEGYYNSVISAQSPGNPPSAASTATDSKSPGDVVASQAASKSIPPEPLLLSRPLIPKLLSAIEQEPSLPSSPAAADGTTQQEMTKLTGLGPELARAVDQVSLRISDSTKSH